MKLICQYSGTSLTSKQFPSAGDLISPHPLMLQPAKRLIAMASHWPEMDRQEKHVYFIALLKSTEHVEFLRPALPSLATILKNTTRLIHALGWMHVIQSSSPIFFKLPRYKIDHTNFDCHNIKHWLQSWEDIKSDWTLQIDKTALRKRLSMREEAIDKLFRSPHKKLTSYSKILADWAFQASNTPVSYRERWQGILAAKDDEIDLYSKQEIEDFIQFMQENLTEAFGEFRYTEFMRHLNSQLEARELGVINRAFRHLGESAKDINSNLPYRFSDDIKQEDAKEAFKLRILATAPKVKPVVTDYADRVSWLKALGAYNQLMNYMQDEADARGNGDTNNV